MLADPCVSGPSLTLSSAETEVMSPNPNLSSINPEDEADLPDSDSSTAATNAEFDPVLEAINFDALKSFVLDTRLKRDGQLSLGISEKTNNLTCHIEEKPIFGSSNVLFVITFSDDVKWIARFPGYGVSSFGVARSTTASLGYSIKGTYSFFHLHSYSRGICMGFKPRQPSWSTLSSGGIC